MSVESWDPKTSALPNQEALECVIKASATRAEADGEVKDFGLSSGEIQKYAALMQLPLTSWRPLVDDLESSVLINLIKFFTLAEQSLQGWKAGARSPVIVLAKVLREKSAYPDELTVWIKANSNNRFLPHGSLMDRL
ncbi:MAG: hypothetical protein KUG75_09100 [Pseudomonadales bacterium]|nr:hypothetical protein [Pseudomonadales bacterium]